MVKSLQEKKHKVQQSAAEESLEIDKEISELKKHLI
jgi:hypothetical protein